MDSIDKAAWRIAARRSAKFALYSVGVAAFAVAIFWLGSIIQSSQYAELIGKVILVGGYSGLLVCFVWSLLRRWKESIKAELTTKYGNSENGP